SELFSVPIEGGSVTKLNAPIAAGGLGVRNLAITPDGSRVVYSADQETPAKYELYSVPIEGGTVTKLNSPFDQIQRVGDIAITPDGTRLVYEAFTGDAFELFSMPIEGGTSTKLNPE